MLGAKSSEAFVSRVANDHFEAPDADFSRPSAQ